MPSSRVVLPLRALHQPTVRYVQGLLDARGTTLKAFVLVRRTGLEWTDDLCIRLHLPSYQPMVLTMCSWKRTCPDFQHPTTDYYSDPNPDAHVKQPDRDLPCAPGSDCRAHPR